MSRTQSTHDTIPPTLLSLFLVSILSACLVADTGHGLYFSFFFVVEWSSFGDPGRERTEEAARAGKSEEGRKGRKEEGV